MTGYALDNSWDRAKRRLSLLEQYLDPMTKRRLSMLGVGLGSRCLEVGAGGGSIAAWMCEQVGAAGSVVATDINIELIQDMKHANFTAKQHDITKDTARTIILSSCIRAGCSTTFRSRSRPSVG